MRRIKAIDAKDEHAMEVDEVEEEEVDDDDDDDLDDMFAAIKQKPKVKRVCLLRLPPTRSPS